MPVNRLRTYDNVAHALEHAATVAPYWVSLDSLARELHRQAA